MSKRTRNIFLKTAAVILLLLFCVYGIMQHRQYKSYQIPIHREAQTVFKVSVDGLITVFLREYEFDFSKDPATIENKKNEPVFSDMGIAIPANLFIYTLSAKSPTTFFCTLPVNDSTKFKQYARKTLKLIFLDKQNYSKGITADGKITVFCDNKQASIAYSLQKEDVSDVLYDLINGKNILSSSDTLMKNLKREKGHITCINKSGTVSLDIKDNLLILNGALKEPESIYIPPQSKRRIFNDSTAAFFFINVKPATTFNKTYKIKQYVIEVDSILKYYNGYVDMALGGMALQQDTVTTYEYNDNFEKTPVQTVKQINIPQFQAFFQSNTDKTMSYLNKQGITIEDKYLNREVFPLYLVSISNTKDQLNFHTTGSKIIDSSFVSSSDFFGFFADTKKVREIHNPVVIAKYTKGIQFIKASGKINGQKQAIIEGVVSFEKPGLKAIREMIQLF